jgi:hypothetical protein
MTLELNFVLSYGIDLLLGVVSSIKAMILWVPLLGPLDRAEARVKATHKPIRDAIFKGIGVLGFCSVFELPDHLFCQGLAPVWYFLPAFDFFEDGGDKKCISPVIKSSWAWPYKTCHCHCHWVTPDRTPGLNPDLSC